MTRKFPFLVVFLAPFGDLKAETYPRPQLLLEPAELVKPEVADEFRILDARPKKEFAAGHIPGAIWVDHDAWSKAFAASQDPRTWEKRLGTQGLDGRRAVVIYDNHLSNRAGRIWWILKYWGLKDVRLLNGGWLGWTKGDYPLSTVDFMFAKPRVLLGNPDGKRLTSKTQLLKALPNGELQIIDTRSEGEFCGTTEKAKRNGSIPGARHLEWSDTLDKKTQRFKSAAELKELFRKSGIALDRPSVTYCQSGGRAAVMAFVLELMGAQDVSNYYRSWAEWGNEHETPIARPKKPAEK
jgi:thiosulfate/3-mercaptopyruvate sulfurtransferase